MSQLDLYIITVIKLLLSECEKHDADYHYVTSDDVIVKANEVIEVLKAGSE